MTFPNQLFPDKFANTQVYILYILVRTLCTQFWNRRHRRPPSETLRCFAPTGGFGSTTSILKRRALRRYFHRFIEEKERVVLSLIHSGWQNGVNHWGISELLEILNSDNAGSKLLHIFGLDYIPLFTEKCDRVLILMIVESLLLTKFARSSSFYASRISTSLKTFLEALNTFIVCHYRQSRETSDKFIRSKIPYTDTKNHFLMPMLRVSKGIHILDPRQNGELWKACFESHQRCIVIIVQSIFLQFVPAQFETKIVWKLSDQTHLYLKSAINSLWEK